MSRSSTRSLIPLNNTQRSRPNRFAQSSRRTSAYFPRMDWIQITIRYICASCSGLGMEGKKGNPCMSDLKRYSKSWDFRSNLFQMEKTSKMLRETSPQTSGTSLVTMRKYEELVDCECYRDDPRSVSGTTTTVRVRENCVLEPPCHNSNSLNR